MTLSRKSNNVLTYFWTTICGYFIRFSEEHERKITAVLQKIHLHMIYTFNAHQTILTQTVICAI